VKGPEDEELIRSSLSGYEILGFLPEMPEIIISDRDGVRPFEDISDAPKALFEIAQKLVAINANK
jgi:CO dehydrogenase maturation factor